jgi:hypothetical protein
MVAIGRIEDHGDIDPGGTLGVAVLQRRQAGGPTIAFGKGRREVALHALAQERIVEADEGHRCAARLHQVSDP